MPVKWIPEMDQLLLLKILETCDVNADAKKISAAWPTDCPHGLPTPRAITERLVKIRNSAKKTGAAHFNISSAQNKGTSVKRASGTPRKPRTTTNSARTPGSGDGKRKRDGNGVASGKGEDANGGANESGSGIGHVGNGGVGNGSGNQDEDDEEPVMGVKIPKKEEEKEEKEEKYADEEEEEDVFWTGNHDVGSFGNRNRNRNPHHHFASAGNGKGGVNANANTNAKAVAMDEEDDCMQESPLKRAKREGMSKGDGYGYGYGNELQGGGEGRFGELADVV